jgi:hypothetical protein
MVEVPESNRVHASAVTYLIDGHEEEAARILLSCDLEVEAHFVWLAPDEGYNDGTFDVELAASRAIYEIISNSDHSTTKLIQRHHPDCCGKTSSKQANKDTKSRASCSQDLTE